MRNKTGAMIMIFVCVSVLAVSLLFVWASELERWVAIRTIALGLGASAVALPLGGTIAWVCRGNGIVPRVLLITCVGLLFIPLFLHVSAWDSAFGRLGWYSTGGQSLEPILTGWTAAIWIHGIAAAPQVALIIWLGLAFGNRVYEEQALMDAAPLSVFTQITSRRLAPLIGLSLLWTIVVCAREIAVTDIFRIGTLAEQIYLGYSLGQLNAIGTWTDQDIAAAESTSWQLTIAIVFWITVTVAIVCVDLFRPRSGHDDHAKPNWNAHHSSVASSLIGGCIWFVIACIPLANLFIRASKSVDNIAGVPTITYSISEFNRSLSRAVTDYRPEFQWSMTISLVSASVLVVLAVLLAWKARQSRWWRYVMIFTIAITCSIPGPLVGALLVQLFTSIDIEFVTWLYDRTIFPATIATCLFCWPLVSLFVYFAISSTASETLENAQLEGASSGTRLISMAISGNWQTLTGCFLLTWTLCFGELSASQMVLPPGVDTIPRLTLGLLHAGVNEMTAALTIVNAGAIIAVSLAGCKLVSLHQRRTSRK